MSQLWRIWYQHESTCHQPDIPIYQSDIPIYPSVWWVSISNLYENKGRWEHLGPCSAWPMPHRVVEHPGGKKNHENPWHSGENDGLWLMFTWVKKWVVQKWLQTGGTCLKMEGRRLPCHPGNTCQYMSIILSFLELLYLISEDLE